MEKDYLEYLKQIKKNIEFIFSLIEEYSLKDFENDEVALSAVLYKISLIGEAGNRIPKIIQKKKYPDIPWKEIIGLRNFVLHQYDKVNVRVVWNTIKISFPQLLAKVNAYLENS